MDSPSTTKLQFQLVGDPEERSVNTTLVPTLGVEVEASNAATTVGGGGGAVIDTVRVRLVVDDSPLRETVNWTV
jgi:hypothetical protein